MENLAKFQSDLEELIGKPTDLRPFVCEGSPLECKIFIVGINPATALKRSFWDFWRPNYGYQKTEWFEAYKQERREEPLAPGKKRRNEISNTRRVIEWIIAEARPMPVLETNLYATPTKRQSDLREQERVTKPFDFLLQTIRPQIMLLHGNDASSYFQTAFNAQFKRDQPQLIEVMWGKICVVPVSHLSRGWGEVRARDIGQQLRLACRA